jgi:phenylacetate-CoA ligase
VNPFLLNQYYRCPPLLQSALASAHGCYLRAWRYGRETDRLVEEALERDTWSETRWAAWRAERLAHVLHRAAARVPFYREQWLHRRRRGDRASVERLENWPMVDKAALRRHPRAFVADDCDWRLMFHEHTSGTTGTSLDLWWSRRTVIAWYALSEARWRRWYGVTRRDRWAILGGQLVVPVKQRQPPFWVWNAALRQLYLSAYHLAPSFIPQYLDALARHEVVYLLGYPSALHVLAREALRLGRRDVRLATVIANAEPLFDHQRRTIEAAFGCPVRETYGMAEIVAAAGECEHRRLHLWPEVGVIERGPADPGSDLSAGELVCTGLLNDDMPLIRYRVGDRGTLAQGPSECACGRTLPRLQSLEGREDDVLYTVDGRQVGRLDPVFKAGLPVLEAQIVQETLRRIRVRFVPAPDYRPAADHVIARALRARLGDVEVVMEPMAEIPRTRAGKFRAVICDLPVREREALASGDHRESHPRTAAG